MGMPWNRFVDFCIREFIFFRQSTNSSRNKRASPSHQSWLASSLLLLLSSARLTECVCMALYLLCVHLTGVRLDEALQASIIVSTSHKVLRSCFVYLTTTHVERAPVQYVRTTSWGIKRPTWSAINLTKIIFLCLYLGGECGQCHHRRSVSVYFGLM